MKRILTAAASPSRSSSRWLVVALAALLAFGAALSARAQGGPAGGADPADPPDRVARLAEASGKVWLFSPDASEWIAIDRNRPLTTGDRIATDNGAHAELALGSTTVRLDSATELEIVLLDDNVFNVHLHSGSVAARIRQQAAVAEFMLDTDEGRFRPRSAGRYRFDRFDQASDLTVEAGQAAYEGRSSALPLGPGQHAQFWLDASGVPQYNMLEPARDGFAAWNADRDRAEARPVAATRYVSPEMTGAEDLDRYGQWEQSPEYGPIWTPRAVGVGWAPYSAGHWAFVRPWGWTWVDDAPWGFAPFHYGRWVHYRNRWCWAPGTYVARPVYAPALVGWVGGSHVSVSISIGGGRSAPPVGWFPLAPREVYVPPYRYSSRYVRNINVTHVTNVTQITTIVNNTNGAADRREFANRKFPHAVTVVPASVMTSRAPVAAEAARVRTDPGVRALLADSRQVAASPAVPVAAPPAPAKPPAGGKTAVTRPPFEGRAPGFAGRPGERDGDRGRDRSPGPGAAPQANVNAAPVPAPGAAPVRPGAPAVAARPEGVPPPRGEADAGNGGRGHGNDGRPPAPNAAPQPNVAPQPNAQATTPPPAVTAPPPRVQAAPTAPADDERGRGRRGSDDPRGRPGGVPPPPVAGAAPVAPPAGRGNDNRTAEQRAAEYRAAEQRANEQRAERRANRTGEAPRVQVRPVDREHAPDAQRTPPPQRAAEPPHAAPPKPAEAKAEPARNESRGNKSSEKRDSNDKNERSEKGEKQR